MASDQIMSNILPLQVFAICSFQMWDLLKAGVIMGRLYPLSFLSHCIPLQLMLQQESHVITLAFQRCPHEQGRRDSRPEEEREAGGILCMREGEESKKNPQKKQTQNPPKTEKQLNLCWMPSWACCVFALLHATLVYHCSWAQSDWCQRGRRSASTAVITHRHGDHFWPAVDGWRGTLLQFLIRLACHLTGRHRWAGVWCLHPNSEKTWRSRSPKYSSLPTLV